MADHTLEQAYRYCGWLTYRHYENFPVASWILPKASRPHIAAIYAFARSADDFADESRYQGRSMELLESWRRALHSCANGQQRAEGHPIFLALGNTIRKCQLPVQWLDDLLTAFTMDVTKRRYATWEELLGYCRYSANPVGRLVLTVFGIRDPQLHLYSDRICTALQLANHCQDLRIDLARDLLYIPQTLLAQYGVTEEELKNLAARPEPSGKLRMTGKFQALMAELVRRARELFDEGAPLIGRACGRLRFELKLTLLGGRTILDRIESAQYDVFRRRPVLSVWSKATLLFHAARR